MPKSVISLPNDSESMQYALELESVLSKLDQRLHESDDPDEIVIHALKTAREFYGGDWVGFLEVDLELSIWTPCMWYNANPEDHSLDMIEELESVEFLYRWVDAMKEDRPIIVSDRESRKHVKLLLIQVCRIGK